MTDVEKYGVFALVFVMGVLGLIVFYEPASEGASAAIGGQSVIIRSAADVPLTAGLGAPHRQDRDAQNRPGGTLPLGNQGQPQDGRAGRTSTANDTADERAARYRVRSPADGVGSFDFTEPPLRYPGERTSLGRPGKDGSIVHVVRKGETLSDISKIYYGTSSRWKEILRLNPKLEPTKMRPGDEIVVSRASPAIKRSATVMNTTPSPTNERVAHAATGEPASAPRTYVVQKGDTLGQIAQRLLGSVKRLDDLYAANKGVLSSPHDLKVGMELSIP